MTLLWPSFLKRIKLFLLSYTNSLTAIKSSNAPSPALPGHPAKATRDIHCQNQCPLSRSCFKSGCLSCTWHYWPLYCPWNSYFLTPLSQLSCFISLTSPGQFHLLTKVLCFGWPLWIDTSEGSVIWPTMCMIHQIPIAILVHTLSSLLLLFSDRGLPQGDGVHWSSAVRPGSTWEFTSLKAVPSSRCFSSSLSTLGLEIHISFPESPVCQLSIYRKEIKPVNPKGNQPSIFIGRIDAEAEVPTLWPPDAKSWLLRKDPDAGKDWRQEDKRATEDDMVG